MNTKETFFDFMDAVVKSSLTPNERLVALVIAKRYYIKGDAFPGNALIASDAGIKDERTIIKAKKTLSEQGFVTSIRRGKQKSNAYVCSVPAAVLSVSSEPTSVASSPDELTVSVPTFNASAHESELASHAEVNLHPVQSELAFGAECTDIGCGSKREEEKRSINREDKREDIDDLGPLEEMEESGEDDDSSLNDFSLFSNLINKKSSLTSSNVSLTDDSLNVETPVASQPITRVPSVLEQKKAKDEELLKMNWNRVVQPGIQSRSEFTVAFDEVNEELVDELTGKYKGAFWLAAVVDAHWKAYQTEQGELVPAGGSRINSKQQEWENGTW